MLYYIISRYISLHYCCIAVTVLLNYVTLCVPLSYLIVSYLVLYVYVSVYVPVYVYVYVSVNACVCVSLYVSIYVYVYVYVYEYNCMYMYMYMCMCFSSFLLAALASATQSIRDDGLV